MHASPVLALLIAIAGGALAGCAGEAGRYPGFAIPQAGGERVSGQLSPGFAVDLPDPAEAAAPLPEDLAARIAALARAGEEAQRDFTQASGDASRLVAAARGADAQSERWMRAQVALADLTAYRSQTRGALADLDLIAASAELGAVDDPAAAEIAAAQSRLAGHVDEQSRRLAELYSILEL